MTPEFVTVLVAIFGMIIAFLGGYMWGWDDCMRRNELDNINAGADIHAGDGGYQIGTREAYEAFVAKRNESMAIPKLGSGVNYRPTYPDEE
jgi:hypothetical protein